MFIVEFDSDTKYKTFRVVPDDEKVYHDIADVESVEGNLYAVVIDYDNYDSEGPRTREMDFVDAFSKIERAESLALLIKAKMDKSTDRQLGTRRSDAEFAVEYEADNGRIKRLGLSKWFGWGTSFEGVGIVLATNSRLRHMGIDYR